MVDSGAYRSFFPLGIATDLGLQVEEMIEDPDGGQGVGSHFRLWTTTVPIWGGVGLFDLAADGSTQPWGPGFLLSPAFTEHDAFLLGRADFFGAFKVTFETTASSAAFIIEA